MFLVKNGAMLARLQIERSGFDSWPGLLRCVLGHDLSTQVYNGYQRTWGGVGGNPVMD